MQRNLFTYDPSATDAPLPRGRHEVEVIAAETRTSRAGNPMLDVTYRALGRHGEVVLKDYLVATPRSRWKIKHFCESLGISFDKGEIDPQTLVGCRVAVEVGVEDDGQGNDRNVIGDYVGGPGAVGGGGGSGGGGGRAAAPGRGERGNAGSTENNGRAPTTGAAKPGLQSAAHGKGRDASGSPARGGESGEDVIPF